MIVNGYTIEPGADLRGANLREANLRAADLRGADLRDANGLLQGDGDRMKHVKLTSVGDIGRAELLDFVKQAVELNKELGNPTLRGHL